MKQYRKKPVVISAIRWDGTKEVYDEITNMSVFFQRWDEDSFIKGFSLYITIFDEEMEVELGDWIIKGVDGELCYCKPDIFELTYEEVK